MAVDSVALSCAGVDFVSGALSTGLSLSTASSFCAGVVLPIDCVARYRCTYRHVQTHINSMSTASSSSIIQQHIIHTLTSAKNPACGAGVGPGGSSGATRSSSVCFSLSLACPCCFSAGSSSPAAATGLPGREILAGSDFCVSSAASCCCVPCVSAASSSSRLVGLSGVTGADTVHVGAAVATGWLATSLGVDVDVDVGGDPGLCSTTAASSEATVSCCCCVCCAHIYRNMQQRHGIPQWSCRTMSDGLPTISCSAL